VRAGRLQLLTWAALFALVAGALLWLARDQRCEAACAAAADVGEPEAALAAIDEADARCDCMRFTEGDEPPEHAAVRAALEALRARGGDVAGVLARGRGPILRAFAAADAAGR
jgi:hypothetical protein